MKYSIIVIGDELLIGQVTDTNSGWIARTMAPLGWEAHDVITVRDDAAMIEEAITRAFENTPVVLTTGGLGPTKDDITKETLRRFFGGTMVLHEPTRACVERMFASRGLAMNELTASQAMVPSSCRVIVNEVGTAPIMWFEREGKVLVAMPGVPQEMRTMMERQVVPQLQERFAPREHIEHRTLVVIDYAESALAMKLSDFEEQLPAHVHLAYLPQQGLVRLRLSGTHRQRETLQADMDRLVNTLCKTLGNSVIATQDLPLEQIVGNKLKEHHLTLATAESCTGGNIAHRITSVAGSSEYFNGGVVSYSNDVKHHVLGVDNETLNTCGAVSRQVVEQMACGASRVCGTHCAVATSGVAGPGGGTPEKPVGTVWMAAQVGDVVVSKCHHFTGNRAIIIDRATTHALIMLLRLLQ